MKLATSLVVVKYGVPDMKRVLSVLIVATIWAVASAQTKTDREQAGLLGPVKTVRTEVSEVEPKDRKSVEARRVLVHVITYDVRGRFGGAKVE